MGNTTSGVSDSISRETTENCVSPPSVPRRLSVDNAASPNGKRQRRTSIITPGTFVRKQEGNFSDRYKGVSLLGKGSFGRVVLCKDRTTGNEAAVKVMAKRSLKLSDDLKLLMREVELLKSLDHPNIMKIFEFFEDDNHFYVVGEVYRGGELFDEIVRRKKFTEPDAKVVVRQILSGISYLHQRNISHRDMKPENILLEKEDEIEALKIIDFGLSTVYEAKKNQLSMKERTGTAYYVAPEVLKGSYNEKCDVWSVGVILYILLSGCPPFHGQNESEILKRVEQGRFTFRLPQFERISEQGKNMIRACLLFNPEQRLSAQELIHHEWFYVGEMQPRNFLDKTSISIINQMIKQFDSFAEAPRLTQSMLFYIASKLTTLEETRILKSVFSAIDTNGDGRLSKEELTEAYMKLLRRKGSKSNKNVRHDVKVFMEVADFDRDGFIDISEFVTIAIDRKDLLTKERLKKCFMMFDPDGSGRIRPVSLRTVFEQTCSERECEEYVQEMDFDGDGAIDFEDFKIAIDQF
eukprot:GHVH01007285.1.p1 GENE.GHVH01007285.1~~GHVH01007285.1.p1  ORF type:complete len:522 (+),score=95.80 GHVH01007285.1:335-1900(+)